MAAGANLDGFPFEKVVSLGAHCAVRYQIDRYFGRAGSGPFEWTVTPLQSVIDAISNRFEGIAQRIVSISDGHSTVDQRYGICFHHEFERGPDGKAIIDVPALVNMRSKMEHKCRSFEASLSKGPVLFVRYGSEKKDAIANIGLHDESMRYSRLNELIAAISASYPRLDFRLAYVHHFNVWKAIIPDEVLDPRVDLFEFSWDAGTDWTGNQDLWDEIFESYTKAGRAKSASRLNLTPVDPTVSKTAVNKARETTDPAQIMREFDAVIAKKRQAKDELRARMFYTDKMKQAIHEASFLHDKIDAMLIDQQDRLADMILGSVTESRRVIDMVKYELEQAKAEASRLNDQ